MRVPVEFDLGDRVALADCDVKYRGTRTGSAGAANIEWYDVYLDDFDVVMEGTWDNNALHNIVVKDIPNEIKEVLRPLSQPVEEW